METGFVGMRIWINNFGEKFAGPLAQGVLDLVFCDPCGRYWTPPCANRAPPGGDPSGKQLRRSPVEVPPKSRRSPVAHKPVGFSAQKRL